MSLPVPSVVLSDASEVKSPVRKAAAAPADESSQGSALAPPLTLSRKPSALLSSWKFMSPHIPRPRTARERPCAPEVAHSVEASRGRPCRLLLVRHGLSEANKNLDLYETMPDQAIPLARGSSVEDDGFEQARATGQWIKEFYEQRLAAGEKPRVIAISSCYERARQTTKEIVDAMGLLLSGYREHILIGEQDFGVFEGTGWTKLAATFPVEIARLKLAGEKGQWFWARMPQGESRFDVCRRVGEFFGTLFRLSAEGYTDFVIVAHGVTVRAIRMMWLHYSPEWFEQSVNPANCSVHLIDRCLPRIDQGCVFPGFSGFNASAQSRSGAKQKEQKEAEAAACAAAAAAAAAAAVGAKGEDAKQADAAAVAAVAGASAAVPDVRGEGHEGQGGEDEGKESANAPASAMSPTVPTCMREAQLAMAMRQVDPVAVAVAAAELEAEGAAAAAAPRPVGDAAPTPSSSYGALRSPQRAVSQAASVSSSSSSSSDGSANGTSDGSSKGTRAGVGSSSSSSSAGSSAPHLASASWLTFAPAHPFSASSVASSSATASAAAPAAAPSPVFGPARPSGVPSNGPRTRSADVAGGAAFGSAAAAAGPSSGSLRRATSTVPATAPVAPAVASASAVLSKRRTEDSDGDSSNEIGSDSGSQRAARATGGAAGVAATAGGMDGRGRRISGDDVDEGEAEDAVPYFPSDPTSNAFPSASLSRVPTGGFGGAGGGAHLPSTGTVLGSRNFSVMDRSELVADLVGLHEPEQEAAPPRQPSMEAIAHPPSHPHQFFHTSGSASVSAAAVAAAAAAAAAASGGAGDAGGVFSCAPQGDATKSPSSLVTCLALLGSNAFPLPPPPPPAAVLSSRPGNDGGDAAAAAEQGDPDAPPRGGRTPRFDSFPGAAGPAAASPSLAARPYPHSHAHAHALPHPYNLPSAPAVVSSSSSAATGPDLWTVATRAAAVGAVVGAVSGAVTVLVMSRLLSRWRPGG